MNSVDNNTRSSFFPNSKSNQASQSQQAMKSALKRNDSMRMQELESTRQDAKVNISDSIRDYSRIKKAVDAAPEVDNSEKIANLKAQIKSGNYKFDYEALADRLLEQEF